MSAIQPNRSYDTSTSGLVALGAGIFAAVMLTIVAVFQILIGIAAIAEDTVYLQGAEYTYELDLTTWGWIHLGLGIVGLAVGIAILAGQDWGLLAGIVIASLAAITNFAFLPYYPWWSLASLGFNALVIWALSTQYSRRVPYR